MINQVNSDGEENFQEQDIQELYQLYSGNSPPTFRKILNDSNEARKNRINTTPSQPLRLS